MIDEINDWLKEITPAKLLVLTTITICLVIIIFSTAFIIKNNNVHHYNPFLCDVERLTPITIKLSILYPISSDDLIPSDRGRNDVPILVYINGLNASNQEAATNSGLDITLDPPYGLRNIGDSSVTYTGKNLSGVNISIDIYYNDNFMQHRNSDPDNPNLFW